MPTPQPRQGHTVTDPGEYVTDTITIRRRFAYEPDIAAGEAPTHAVYVERIVWRDMGEPDTITVTIEPGDLLNEA